MTDINHADYWETYTDHPASCYKHEGDSSHGYLNQGGYVLNPFDQSWPGDHWELLVVKGGNGYEVYVHPTAGQVYYAPDNPSGEPAGVSHIIVCKGTTPDVTPTPTNTPTSTPTPSPSVTNTPTPTPTPTPTVTPSETPTTPTLAETGPNMGWLSLAVVFVLGGVALAGAARRVWPRK